jgi:hypothetical protein
MMGDSYLDVSIIFVMIVLNIGMRSKENALFAIQKFRIFFHYLKIPLEKRN